MLGTILAVVAALAIPLSIASSWTRTLVDDVEPFMDTYAPVLDTEAMNQVISQGLTSAIEEKLKVEDNSLAGDAVALVVDEAMATDGFADAKRDSLRLLHEELRAQLVGESGNVDVHNGQVNLRLEPFSAIVNERLSEAGVPFVDHLPEMSGEIALFTIDPETLPTLQQGFRGMDRAATVLPWAAAGLLIVALVLSPRRSWVLTSFGLSLALWVLAVGFSWDFGIENLVSRLEGPLAQVAEMVADLTSQPVATPLEVIAVGGVVLAVAATIAGRRWTF
ncbi:hypothetical protein VR010_03640 [Actinomycetaceae bacterium L2_0104]